MIDFTVNVLLRFFRLDRIRCREDIDSHFISFLFVFTEW